MITDEMEHAATDLGIKLEYVDGLPVWEALPVYRHQKKTLDIQISIVMHAESSGCTCIPVADTTIVSRMDHTNARTSRCFARNQLSKTKLSL